VSEGPKPPDEVVDFYALGLEKDRLDEDFFPLERARTQELILRHLPPPPGTILDVGGAAGAYALWLAERGYAVHLVDPVPLHVRQAEEASRARSAGRLASARVGDARSLGFTDASTEAVLLLGPLYHLIDRADRLRALAEARRVLKLSGLVFAAACGPSAKAQGADAVRAPQPPAAGHREGAGIPASAGGREAEQEEKRGMRSRAAHICKRHQLQALAPYPKSLRPTPASRSRRP